jgi:RNA polymerase sigma-70 factor (ECF subfamily)
MQPGEPVAAAREAPDQALLALIGRVARGDQGALAALYDETSSMVHGLALRILRDESAAEDVTVDVYMQVFRQASSYDAQRGSPLAWLLTLARSRAIDRFRAEAQRRLRETPLETVEVAVATTNDPAESALAGESRRAVREALAALAPEQRRAIELAYYTGMSHTEIAEALRQPLGTIKTRIRTGMLALRDRLRSFHAEARA